MSWFDTHLLVVIGIGAAVCMSVLILQQRRTPQSTVAWLLFALVFPYLAIPTFLALGFRKQRSRSLHVALSPHAGQRSAPAATDLVLQSFGVPRATGGNAFRLIADGQDCWDELDRLIADARVSIDATFYLIRDDAVGRRFVEMLAERAGGGVKVRLMIDRFGALSRPRRELDALRAAGGEVRYHSPFLASPSKGHLNLRNHRKMVIADGQKVLSGGRNVGSEYLGPDPDPGRWHDLSFALEGPAVATFIDVFAADWVFVGGEPSPPPPEIPPLPEATAVAQLVPAGPDIKGDPLHDALVNAIHSARRRVWVASPYFLPTEHLEHALGTAARRGLDVRIMVPRKSNQRVADIARGEYLRDLDERGCRILQFERGMMHAKTGVIDDAAWVGSANFDIRSMLLNFEASLFLYDADSVAAIAAWFAELEPDCTLGATPAKLPRRVVEGFFRLGAPQL